MANIYIKNNSLWELLSTFYASGLEDAPSDGITYARLNNKWIACSTNGYEIATVTLTTDDNKSCKGQIVTILGIDYIYDGNPLKVAVPHGLNYSVKINGKLGYTTPLTLQKKSGGYSATFNYEYIKLKSGVYLIKDNFECVVSDHWSANNKAIGIGVLTNENNYMLALDAIGNYKFGGYGSLIPSMATTLDSNLAKLDYAGEDNTNKIREYIFNDTAAEFCNNYYFPNGLQGYLPSIGELLLLYNNKTQINNCLAKVSRKAIDNVWMLSSTQYNENNNWLFNWTNSTVSANSKNNAYQCRPITKF